MTDAEMEEVLLYNYVDFIYSFIVTSNYTCNFKCIVNSICHNEPFMSIVQI